jgi:hypothetical protein
MSKKFIRARPAKEKPPGRAARAIVEDLVAVT